MPTRLMFSAVLVMLLVALALVGFLAIQLIQEGPAPMLSGRAYDSPQKVVTRVVPQGGTMVVWRAQKCNDTDQPIRVRSVTTWQVHNGVTISVAGHSTVSEPIPAGTCWPHEIANKVWEHQLPAQVIAGLDWRLTGTETPEYLDGTQGQPRDWKTELIRVTP